MWRTTLSWSQLIINSRIVIVRQFSAAKSQPRHASSSCVFLCSSQGQNLWTVTWSDQSLLPLPALLRTRTLLTSLIVANNDRNSVAAKLFSCPRWVVLFSVVLFRAHYWMVSGWDVAFSGWDVVDFLFIYLFFSAVKGAYSENKCPSEKLVDFVAPLRILGGLFKGSTSCGPQICWLCYRAHAYGFRLSRRALD